MGSRSSRAMALNTARWQFRSTSTLLPGGQHRASPVWMPWVEPPVRNWQYSKPNSLAHRAWAEAKGSPPSYRFPVGGSSVRSMGVIHFSSAIRGTGPPLCPGIWNRKGSWSAYFFTASYKGVGMGHLQLKKSGGRKFLPPPVHSLISDREHRPPQCGGWAPHQWSRW